MTAAADLARAFFAALAAHDAAAALELLAPDAEVDVVHAPGAGRGYVTALAAAFPDLLVRVRGVIGTPERAVVEVTLEGTQAADFLGVVNQEKHLDVEQAWVFGAAGGRITAIRAYGCANQVYRRLAVKRLDQISILGGAR